MIAYGDGCKPVGCTSGSQSFLMLLLIELASGLTPSIFLCESEKNKSIGSW